MDPGRHGLLAERTPTRHFVDASRAGAGKPEQARWKLRNVAVAPPNPQALGVLGGCDLERPVAGILLHDPVACAMRAISRASARNAFPRWLRASFSAGSISAKVRPSSGSKKSGS